jgi:hypothetical protein
MTTRRCFQLATLVVCLTFIAVSARAQDRGVSGAGDFTGNASTPYLYATNYGTFNDNTIYGIDQYSISNVKDLTLERFMPVNSPYFIVAKSGDVYVDDYYNNAGSFIQGVGLLTPGSTSPVQVAVKNAAINGSLVNDLAVSANEKNVFVLDENPAGTAFQVSEYSLLTHELVRAYTPPIGNEPPGSIAIDGTGHLWIAWRFTLAEYTQTETTPIQIIPMGTNYQTLYIDQKGAMWSVQNSDKNCSGGSEDCRFFLPGQCVYDPNGPQPGDDQRGIIMQRYYKGIWTLYFSTPLANGLGDGDGNIDQLAIDTKGYAYLSWDTLSQQEGAGVNVYAPAAAGNAGPVCPETSGELSLPAGTLPTLATDEKKHLYVGLSDGSGPGILDIFSSGADPALMAEYPDYFAEHLLRENGGGGTMVVQ